MRSRRWPSPWSARACRSQRGVPFLSIVPIAESRSSYNGLLVFLFMVFSGVAAAVVIHRFASNRLRRGPAWDCGYPDPSTATQYTASSFAQPIRRVFGTLVFRASEQVEMPPPGDMRPARSRCDLTDVHLGRALRADRRRRRLCRRTGSTACSFSPSATISASSSSPWSAFSWCSRYGPDRSISRCRPCRCCWCSCSRRCSSASCARSRRGCCAGKARRSSSLTAISCG